jgi:integrase
VPKLSKRTVTAARPNPIHDVILWDDALTGFGLRVWPSGRKVFIIQYRNAQGRIRRVNVGKFGRLTADEGRQLAKKLLANVHSGGDPAEERGRARKGETFRDLAVRYLQEHAVKKKPSSAALDRRLLERCILPSLATRKVADITRADIGRLHHSLRSTPVQANRVIIVLSKMLNLAERWGLRPDGSNPCRHIDRFREVKRERFLSDDELARLGEVLAQAEGANSEIPSAILAIRLLLLTGARFSEILTLRWDSVDFQRSALRLADSKTGPKWVPLGAPAAEALYSTRRLAGNPYVCWGQRAGCHLVGLHKVWERLRRQAGLEDVRLHDLRHSYASVGAGAGIGLLIIGKILGHASAATTARYAHLAESPAHFAADRISSEIAAALKGERAEVIPFMPTRSSGEGLRGSGKGGGSDAADVRRSL